MRPAGKGALESLYFDYPEYAFTRPPELEGKPIQHPVVIVGAGPIGLTAALELARHGVASVILERKTTLNDGSRAICVARQSIETLQQLGIADRFVDKALGWTNGRCYYREQLIYRLQMPHSEHERFLPMYNLQQQYIEQFLVDAVLAQSELIDLRWGSEVTALSQSDQHVALTVSTPQGSYSLQADYLLAADGAHSPIRQQLGLRLSGDNLPGNYVIADIRMEHDFPTERRSFFESAANPRATILIHKQPDNIWRVDWQIMDDEDRAEAISESTIRSRVQAILDMVGHQGGWELEWWSIYTANTLCLDEYRHGRVLFIGDAAHIVPIFGVRGLNNGLSDAVNAGWKLAYVINGLATPALLDSYTPERRGATLDVFRNASKSSRFMTPPTRGYQLLRKAALELALTEDFARPFADPRQVQPYTYADSPLTVSPVSDAAFDGGVAAGAVAINRRISADNYLLDHLGGGFGSLLFVNTAESANRSAALYEHLTQLDPAFKVLIISRTALDGGWNTMLIDHTGDVFSGYDATDGTLYLLRPDRHVIARWRSFTTADVEHAMRIALGET